MKRNQNRVRSKSSPARPAPQTKTTVRTERPGPQKDKGVWIKMILADTGKTISRFKLSTPLFTGLETMAAHLGVSVSRALEIGLSRELAKAEQIITQQGRTAA